MANKLRTVLYQAIKTFNCSELSRIDNVDEVELRILKSYVDGLRLNDVILPQRFLNRNRDFVARFPIDHFSLFENEDVQVGVFIMKHNARIPLHDHPGMYGIIKVLTGTIKITSYNLTQPAAHCEDGEDDGLYYPQPLKATRNNPIYISEHDKCCILTPTVGNIHEVVCTNGPVAFLDILAPPYDDEQRESVARACHYFKVYSESNSDVKLVQIPTPGDYWHHQEC